MGGIKSRINDAEAWISELEDRPVEIIAAEHNKEEWEETRAV